MSKEAQRSVVLSDQAQKKFDECVSALAGMRFGPEGPPEDTTFAEIEAIGHEVGRMLGRAVDQQLTRRHAEQFQKAAACRTCQTRCEPELHPAKRELHTSDGLVPIAEAVCHCSACKRDFLPQRIALKIDGRSYSPNVLSKVMYCAGTRPACHLASKTLDKVGDISITRRHIGNLAEGIGEELANERDARTNAYFNQALPRVRSDPGTSIPLATVSIDGGRVSGFVINVIDVKSSQSVSQCYTVFMCGDGSRACVDFTPVMTLPDKHELLLEPIPNSPSLKELKRASCSVVIAFRGSVSERRRAAQLRRVISGHLQGDRPLPRIPGG